MRQSRAGPGMCLSLLRFKSPEARHASAPIVGSDSLAGGGGGAAPPARPGRAPDSLAARDVEA